FPEARISLDLWFGDAAQCFPLISSKQPIHAWFLDGFAPSCNPELWQDQIFSQIIRLSAPGTTFASFSVAGVLKRALQSYGVHITRPKGFGHKREMLKAVWQTVQDRSPIAEAISPQISQVSIVGAGIAGLNCAWRLAQRGIKVVIYDESAPLSGGSGNPLAMLNPKLSPISQVAIHLMTIGWQYALRFYSQFTAFRPIQIQQSIEQKNLESSKQLLADYPPQILSLHDQSDTPYLVLHKAGALQPQQFAEVILAHPLIEFKQAKIEKIKQLSDQVYGLYDQQQLLDRATHIIVCNALALNQLLPDTPRLKPIRGQVSWVNMPQPFVTQQYYTGYSYGGYAMPLDQNQLIFGASFLPQQTETDTRIEDHQHNLDLMTQILPNLADQLPPIAKWHGRAALRAQTADYFPLVGQVDETKPELYCLAGLGSKGFLFAPICS
ncbi:hypothetical protein GWI33_009997, partial [Rhynchophorus ferrugineus]